MITAELNSVPRWEEIARQDLAYHLGQFERPFRSTVALQNFVSEVAPHASGSALDVACGAGSTIYHLSKMLPNCRWTGIDIAGEVLFPASQKYFENLAAPVRLLTGDFSSLTQQLGGEHFDLTFLIQTLLIIPNYEEILEQLLSITQGWLFITGLITDFDVDARIEVRDYTWAENIQGPYYYNVFSLSRLRRFFEERGCSRIISRDFEIDIDLPMKAGGGFGTYTRNLDDGTRLQFTGPVYQPWKFLAVDTRGAARTSSRGHVNGVSAGNSFEGANHASGSNGISPSNGSTSTRSVPRITNFSRGNALNERLHEMIPGASHTYSKGEDQFPSQSPKLMARAQGAYCWDVDGNRYLDWAMGNRVIILGHCYPAINEAVRRQMDLGQNYTRPGVLEYELAEYLIDLLPVAEMVKFGKNGSDVTTAAVKLARAATGRKYVACCADHPFFSIHDWFIGTTPMNAGVPDEISEQTLRFPYNDIDALKALFDRYPGQIAAIILEPVKNEEPRDNYLAALRELATREGTVLIFDEMISGLRFDLRGAHHRWKVYPDLACFGKAFSNGYSFSLLAGKREIMELGGLRHNKRRVFLLSQTHSSETIGLAACKATLDECQRINVTQHIWDLGSRLVSGIRQLAASEGVSDYVRMTGFDCNPQLLCTKADGTYWPALHTSFHEEVISWGVLIPWTSITYSHNAQELELTFEAIQHGMRKVRRALESDTVLQSFQGEPVKPVFRPYNRCRQSRCGRLCPDAPRLDCCGE